MKKVFFSFVFMVAIDANMQTILENLEFKY